jgi:hypothetical protein
MSLKPAMDIEQLKYIVNVEHLAKRGKNKKRHKSKTSTTASE